MGRKLHIGGTSINPGWEVLNALPGEFVDHLGNANDLSQFPDGTFSIIYASHVLEHLDYTAELQLTLAEWRRTLEPGGLLCLSVPDLDTLTELFVDKKLLSIEERFLVMRMIFGGHTSQFDYHLTGLNEEFLTEYLTQSGFIELQRVESLGYFSDTSELELKGRKISLNMQAINPLEEG
ncbi:methyltransferase domain-containing protein [Synechococcus sp. ATX 2A4]|nr:methyltransferase domain-containing protein [Synechococcus sp. ATX 2A4]